jgi:CheY-like chemotaxis protein
MVPFRSVLLIDDDADDQELFAEALAVVDQDADIYQAQDGEDAFEVLRHKHPPVPDVIFLDLNMPRKNGIEFLSEVKNRKEYNGIPVIVYSTSAQFKDQTKELGAVHYMVKQNSFKDLCNELKHVLSQKWP